jgi:hypothetical protein
MLVVAKLLMCDTESALEQCQCKHFHHGVQRTGTCSRRRWNVRSSVSGKRPFGTRSYVWEEWFPKATPLPPCSADLGSRVMKLTVSLWHFSSLSVLSLVLIDLVTANYTDKPAYVPQLHTAFWPDNKFGLHITQSSHSCELAACQERTPEIWSGDFRHEGRHIFAKPIS